MEISLQTAMLTTLLASSEIQAILGSGDDMALFDEPPPNKSYPYGVFAEAYIQPWDTSSYRGSRVITRLDFWTNVEGKFQVANLLNLSWLALRDTDLDLSADGYNLVTLEEVGRQIYREGVGTIRRGILEMRALIEEN
jgi:hypothetical protein